MKESFQSLFRREPCKQDAAIKKSIEYFTKVRYIGLNNDIYNTNGYMNIT